MAITAQRIQQAYVSNGKNDLSDSEIADLAHQISGIKLKNVDDYKSQNSIVNLLSGGENGIGSQYAGYAQELGNRLTKYYSSYLADQEKQLQTTNPKLKVQDYYNPVAETYSWGGGASGNLKKTVLDPWMRISEQASAIEKAKQAANQFKTTGQVGATPDTKAYVQSLYKGTDQSLQDQISRSISGTTTEEEKMAANAAAAKVGMKLPYPTSKVGNISSGSVINNADIASGKSYDEMQARAITGKTAQVQNTTSPNSTPASTTPQNNKQTYLDQYPDLGGVGAELLQQLSSGVSTINGKPLTSSQRLDLERNFKAVTGKDPSSYLNDAPLRFNFQTDQQYQVAVDSWNATHKKDNGQLPSNIMDAQNPADANEFLNTLQSNLFSSSPDTDVTTRGNAGTNTDIMGAFQNLLSGGGTQSTPSISTLGGVPQFSAETKLTQLRSQYGVDPLESDVAKLDSQIRAIQDAQVSTQFNEEGKPVAMGVMQGRISTEEQQANDRLNQLNRQKGYLVDQLNTKYNTINTMMQAASTDYTNAKNAYDTQFNQAIQMSDLMMKKTQMDKTDEEKARDDARANVTIVTNALTSGSLQWDTLDPATKAQYSKLEMQAGLPTGTISAFSSAGKNNQWEMSTVLPGTDADGNAVATVLQKNKVTGEFKTTKLITDYSSGKNNAKADIAQSGTYVDDNNHQIAWQIDSSGQKSSVDLGATKADNTISPQDKAASEEQNNFNKYIADIVTQMSTGDETKRLSIDQAIKILKSRYPTLSTDAAKSYLGVVTSASNQGKVVSGLQNWTSGGLSSGTKK